jgi:hypothetical protein
VVDVVGMGWALEKAAEEEGHREESDSLAVLSTTRQDLCPSSSAAFSKAHPIPTTSTTGYTPTT